MLNNCILLSDVLSLIDDVCLELQNITKIKLELMKDDFLTPNNLPQKHLTIEKPKKGSKIFLLCI